MQENKLAARTAQKVLDFYTYNGWTNKGAGVAKGNKIVGPYSQRAEKFNVQGAMQSMRLTLRSQNSLADAIVQHHSWDSFNTTAKRGTVMKTLRTIVKAG